MDVQQYMQNGHGSGYGHAVLRIRIRIRIRMNPHGFGLLDPHPESAFQMRIPDADADPG
jgi:hypothetical protein